MFYFFYMSFYVVTDGSLSMVFKEGTLGPRFDP